MEKLLACFAAFLVCTTSIHSQVEEPGDGILRTKRGVPVLPRKGDWAVGIDATPFFRYAGNIFTSNNNPYYPVFGFTAQVPGAIFGKYKLSEKTTIRGALLIGVSTETSKSANTINPDLVDKRTISALSIGLVGGLERNRQVFGRLAGIYGVQAGVRKDPYNSGIYMGKFRFKDAYQSDNNFKRTGGNTYSVMAGGFLGVEFFVAPRIALAGEFAYNVSFYFQGNRKNVPETGDETILDYGGTGVEFAPGESGNLQLLFYF